MHISFARNGKELGTYPEEAVPGLLATGFLQRSDDYWHDGLPDWIPVSSRWSSPVATAATTATDSRYKQELRDALAEGWVLVAEGASGAQLEKPKSMRLQTKVALTIGFVLIAFFGVGLIIIAAALIDYAMQKNETKFLVK